MERALLDVEQTNELKFIQSEENKIKHLHQEHQLKLEAFNLHMNQIRNEIRIVQMTIKNIENEILILDTTLDADFRLSGLDSNRFDWENIKTQKEHALEEAQRAHEDLEFQLMELEAKYETELEDIQTRLINEQEILIESFKYKNCLSGADQEQQKLINKLKSETEILEFEKKKLIDQFEKQRLQLESIEKKLHKIGENKNKNENLDENENDSPSPASSSASLSSATNSSETSPSINQNYKSNECDETNSNDQRYLYPTSQQQIYQSAFNQFNSNNYSKQLPQSFREILQNTMLINGISEANNYGRVQPKNYPYSPLIDKNNQRSSKSKNLVAANFVSQVAGNVSCLTGSVNHAKIPIDSSDQEIDEYIGALEKKLMCPINGQLAMKFAELNHAKSENYFEQVSFFLNKLNSQIINYIFCLKKSKFKFFLFF